MKHKLLLGIICVVLASCCYGITPILSNTALNGGLPADFVMRVFGQDAISFMAADAARAIPNESMVAISMGLACMLSLVTCVVRKKSLKLNIGQAWQLPVFGGGALLVSLLLITYAYLRIPAGLTIVLNFTYPVIVMFATALFFKEKPRAIMLLPLLAAIGGIALISHSSLSGQLDPLGIGIALISGVMYAIYFLAGRHSSYSELDTSVSNFYITGSAFVLCIMIAFIANRFELPSDPFMWLILFLEALLGYTIGLQLLLKGIGLLGSTAASALNTLEPAFASITSMLVFGESMGIIKGLGVLLVLMAALASILILRHGRSDTDCTGTSGSLTDSTDTYKADM